MHYFALSFLLVLSGFGNSAAAQQTSSSVGSSDHTDAIAYRTLFRRAVLYKKLADEADASHTPKPQLRRILATRYGLNDSDSATLLRLALAYQAEIAPIHQQITDAVRTFQARFPSGIIPRGADSSPPPELRKLQDQEDAVTLRYRDLLRTSMREEDFQKANAKIRENFGKPLAH